MHAVALNTKALIELDALLLHRLTANKEGSLLDDDKLIGVLADTKKKATAVTDQLRQARRTRSDINDKREHYRPVATRGAVLYFSIVDMIKVNPMYQTSLDQFLDLFRQSMEQARLYLWTTPGTPQTACCPRRRRRRRRCPHLPSTGPTPALLPHATLFSASTPSPRAFAQHTLARRGHRGLPRRPIRASRRRCGSTTSLSG